MLLFEVEASTATPVFSAAGVLAPGEKAVIAFEQSFSLNSVHSAVRKG